MLTLSIIVSSFVRPEALEICLRSLRQQRKIMSPEHQPVDLFVTDSSIHQSNQDVAFKATDYTVNYIHTPGKENFEAANIAAKSVATDFIGFASDDNYYVPEYASRSLHAAEFNSLDLVFCDMLYDPRNYGRWTGKYTVVETKPQTDWIDKGGFIMRRTLFESLGGFPLSNRKGPSGIAGKTGPSNSCDGELIERAARSGCRYGKVPEVMFFHG